MSASKNDHIDWMDECDKIAEESVRVEEAIERTREAERVRSQMDLFEDETWNWSGLR